MATAALMYDLVGRVSTGGDRCVLNEGGGGECGACVAREIG